MAEEEEIEEGGGGIVRLLVLVIPALLIGAAGGYFAGQAMTESTINEQEQVQPSAKQEDPTEMVGEIYKLEPFVVNLNEKRGSRYLKTTIQLEMSSPELKAELERRKAQIRDIILALLTSKTSSELQALEGKHNLRTQLASRINALLINGEVKRVYLTQFVIQ